MKKFYFLVIMILMIFIYLGCKKDKEDPKPPTYTNGQGEIGQLGGTIAINDASSPLNGVTIIVPEGALQGNTFIQITSAPDTVRFPGSNSQPLVQLLPEGIDFQKPITIRIPFTSNNPSNLGLFYYNPEEEFVSELEDVTIDVQERLISGLTNHFSYYTAADKEVRATINMVRTQEGIIGVRLDIYGTNNIENGLKWIPTTWWHKVQTLDQELNIWQVLTNPGGPHDGNVYSIFDVFLREDEIFGSDPVSASHFSIIREENDPFKVKIIQRFPANDLYSSGFLHTEDIENNISEMDYKNLGNWINGEPLIFLFDDFVPNPDKNYFVKVKWVLASEPNASPLFNYSPKYELNNKPDKKKLHQMSLTSLNEIDIDRNYIQDMFQVWGVNTAPECNFSADKTEVNVNETIQFSDQSDYNPTSWHWDFGDGNISTQKNPTHAYTSPGEYSVSLEVTNQFGSDTKTIDNFIQVTEWLFIEVISPNGNEDWTIGSDQVITWNDNIDENVKITLLLNNSPSQTISNSTASSGSFNWAIPGSITAGSNYKIKIESVSNNQINDVSNVNFNIVEQGNIIVTNPNANITWTMGQYSVPIEWETGDLGGTVTIQMYKGDNKLGTITPDATNNGSYTGYNVQTTLSEDNDYRIKIISNVNTEKFDFSEYFEIIESDNLPPEPPYDPYPEEEAVLEELTANLFWNCEDPENDPLTYDVYFGSASNPPLKQSNISTNTYQVSNLIENTTYYWRIVAKDDNNNSTDGPIWSFSTQSGGNTAPTALFTVTPSSGTTSTNFAFDASGSTDNEDPTSSLQVRWDFDGNGSWDTNWDTDKTQSHQYSSEATYLAMLEVKDSEGLTDQYTRSITVSNGGGGPDPDGYFTDARDGQEYAFKIIGSQTWMAENLNYETTNSWTYNNDPANGDIYGRLYTWDASLTVCPSGWHLPSDEEWKTMEMALGMSQSEADGTGWRGTDEGGKMKETGYAHWNSPNTGATNSSGFTALPGGYRVSSGSFGYLGDGGYWWSSSEYSGSTAWYRSLNYDNGQVYRYNYNKTIGFSVRCLKD